MKLFEDLVKCKDCINNINNKCILYKGKDVNEEDTGCYVGIDKNHKQKLIEERNKCNESNDKSTNEW